MKISRYMFGALCAIGLAAITACNDSEGELDPTGISSAYTLPQGTHDYDDDIVSFYKSTGTYILYDFTQKEACWTPTGWNLGQTSDDDSGSKGYEPTKADQAYVGQLLKLLHELWLDCYNDKFKKDLFPVKILLCSDLDSVYYAYEYIWTPVFSYTTKYAGSSVPAWYNYHNICVNYANSEVENLTMIQKRYMRAYLNKELARGIMQEEKVEPTSEFEKSVDYSSLKSVYTVADLFAGGTFPSMSALSVSGDSQCSAERDWLYFMYMMMNYSYDYLTDSSVTLDSWYSSLNDLFHGCLSDVKDTSGLIRQHYKMVQDYFKENYDMDLQTVGDASVDWQ